MDKLAAAKVAGVKVVRAAAKVDKVAAKVVATGMVDKVVVRVVDKAVVRAAARVDKAAAKEVARDNDRF